VTYSVDQVNEMARALSAGEFDQQFQQDFQSELGQKSIKEGDRTDLGKSAGLDQNLIDELMMTLH